MKEILPGIKTVAVIDMANLPSNTVLKAMAKVNITIASMGNVVPIVGNPRCALTKSFVGKNRMEEVNLTFYSTENIEKVSQKAFVIVTVRNETFLIGDKDWVLPEVKMDFETGQPGSEPSRYEYKVKWMAHKALIPVQITA